MSHFYSSVAFQDAIPLHAHVECWQVLIQLCYVLNVATAIPIKNSVLDYTSHIPCSTTLFQQCRQNISNTAEKLYMVTLTSNTCMTTSHIFELPNWFGDKSEACPTPKGVESHRVPRRRNAQPTPVYSAPHRARPGRLLQWNGLEVRRQLGDEHALKIYKEKQRATKLILYNMP